jgi:acetylornithine deacetylase/succinyl-diaminopimelate desuccinylase-like protein
MIETNRVVEWLSRLVQIPSVTPENAGVRSGDSTEALMAAEMAKRFAEFGGEVHTEDVFPGRPNTYAIWRAESSDRWLAVDVHVDTVGVETMRDDPFDGRVEDGRVYGRGAVDTKASLAIVLTALEALHKAGRKLDFNLLVCASADEETGATGAVKFAQWVRDQGIQIDQLVVSEPTMCGPVYGHKGTVGIDFSIQGEAVHSSAPDKGKNAVVAAASVITAFAAEHQRLIALPPRDELGTPVLTVSMVKGGQAVNIVPDRCSVVIDRRLVTGESPAALAEELYEMAEQNCSLPLSMNIIRAVAGFYQEPDTPFIHQLAEWSGIEPQVVGYGTNAHAYTGLAKETVVMGPGSIEQAHRDVEWVEIAQLDKMARIYERWWGLDS